MWEALRVGLEPVQIKLHMIEHNCDSASAAAALRTANHDNVETFCDARGVIRTACTPTSFLYCQFGVIEHAWTQLNHVGMSALLATRLWYCYTMWLLMHRSEEYEATMAVCRQALSAVVQYIEAERKG